MNYHFSTLSMEDMLTDMTPEQLRKVSEIWKDFSRRALCRAKNLEERKKMHAYIRQQSKERADVIPQKITHALENGVRLSSACAQIDAEYEAPEGFALSHWKNFIRSSDHFATCLRHKLIFDLASRGQTNAQIGYSIGIHKNSVSRIIGKIKKERARTSNALARSK